ncbi:hypothetical protein CAPTEDRAFT_227116 [Capitella teleta]|uniref:CUB domain-containing protein n=1 Tax=Capitella teleta TaxID=283909 RepID=R7TVR2_CAPTE|nr:hypothetical protein CAPTEDRAFT_227116 [Capitella teleta]|eukprot:ELT97983.1 hypothetical protein CAPTEDRAFT_227116 [Capitella teleta]
MKFLLLCLGLSLANAAVVINPFGDEGACGDDQPRYINESVIFMSPNFGEGETYPPNQNCSWLIEYTGDDEGISVELSFQTFILEECTDCNCDYLAAYDGDSEDGTLVGKRCGNNPTDMYSDSHLMFVRFVSDESTEFPGFVASNAFDILPPSYCVAGGEPLQLTDPTGVVESPGFGEGFYPDNLDCQWQISTPNAVGYRIEFDEDFATEDACRVDFLQLFSGTGSTGSDTKRGQWYGNHSPHVFTIEGGDLYAYFHTDSSVADIGFSFSYTAIM